MTIFGTSYFAAGTKLKAATLNLLTDQIDFNSKPYSAVARRSANQSIPHATSTALQFDTQDLDTASMFAATDSKIYAPAAGLYVASFWAVCTGPNFLIAEMYRNGSSIFCGPAVPTDASGACRISGSFPPVMSSGDYIELKLYQSSTGSVNRDATGRMSLIYRGPGT